MLVSATLCVFYMQMNRDTEDMLVTLSKPCSLFEAKPQSSGFDTILIISWLLHFGSVRG